MNNLTILIVSGLITFVFDILLRKSEPKSKLIQWWQHSFEYNLPNPPNANAHIYVATVGIDNLGKQNATDIEVVYKEKPDHYTIYPPQHYEEKTTPTGEYIIYMPTLAPKTGFAIHLFCFTQYPNLLYVRSKEGYAEIVPVQPQIILPKWRISVIRLASILGVATAFYWLIRFVNLLVLYFYP